MIRTTRLAPPPVSRRTSRVLCMTLKRIRSHNKLLHNRTTESRCWRDAKIRSVAPKRDDLSSLQHFSDHDSLTSHRTLRQIVHVLIHPGTGSPLTHISQNTLQRVLGVSVGNLLPARMLLATICGVANAPAHRKARSSKWSWRFTTATLKGRPHTASEHQQMPRIHRIVELLPVPALRGRDKKESSVVPKECVCLCISPRSGDDSTKRRQGASPRLTSEGICQGRLKPLRQRSSRQQRRPDQMDDLPFAPTQAHPREAENMK